MKSVNLDEFVELCMARGYKSLSIDFSKGSVSVLVGNKRLKRVS